MEKISIMDGETCLITIPRVKELPMETIRAYCENAKGLSYYLDGEKMTSILVNDMVSLVEGVNQYTIFKTTKKPNKLTKFAAKKKADIEKIIEEALDCEDNVRQKKKKIRLSEDEEEEFVDEEEMLLILGWKHQLSAAEEYFAMTGKLGGIKRRQIPNKEYSFKELSEVCVNIMKTAANRFYFEDAIVKIGTSKKIYTDFVDNKNKPCLFSTWKNKVKQMNGQLKLYLYTTAPDIIEQEDHINMDPPKSSSKLAHQGKQMNYSDLLKNTSVRQESNDKRNISAVLYSIENNNNAFLIPEATYSGVHNTENDLEALLKKKKLSVSIVLLDEISYNKYHIGKGGFGFVYKGTWMDVPVALKEIKQTRDNKYLLREIDVLDKIRHPNIISILSLAVEPDRCFIIMEYFDSHSLREVLFYSSVKPKYDLSSKNKDIIGKQLSQAVAFLHSRSVIHKDIKPENILVNIQCQVKLCDMGLSKMEGMSDTLNTTKGVVRGTSFYMSYEMIKDRVGGSFAADVWAIACVMVEIYSEEYVWPNLGYAVQQELEELFTKDPLPVPRIQNIPEILKPVITACFNKDPSQRPKSSTIFDLFKLL